MAQKYAAIDIGSNTVQMLTASLEQGRLTERRNYLRTTRLGAGDSGCLSAEAIAETAAIVAEYMAILRQYPQLSLRILATSAVRDAANSSDLLAALAAQAPDAPPAEILSGQQEAQLSFLGARASTAAEPSWPIIDQGGSSTEIIYQLEGQLYAQSIDMGAVRAQTKGWSRAGIKQRLSAAIKPRNAAKTAVGVGGTVTTAAGLLLDLSEYRREAVEGTELDYMALDKLRRSLIPLSIEQRCASSPLLRQRGQIMEQGLDIWLSLMEILDLKRVVVSGGGILDGAIAEMTGQPVHKLRHTALQAAPPPRRMP